MTTTKSSRACLIGMHSRIYQLALNLLELDDQRLDGLEHLLGVGRGVGLAEALLELRDASAGVEDLLLTRVERVAL